jgi:nicotinamide-nucleotide amidase
MATSQGEEARVIATAELLAVGAELLVGDTRDTNSGDLARELTALGVDVLRASQLPDDRAVVVEAIQTATRRADLVITTGGLGPTPDDLTRESIAQAVGEQPTVDPGLERWLRGIWERRGLTFSDTNLKQAWLISSAMGLDNPNGTAPGWWVDAKDAVIVALPGPPRELMPMWRDHVLPRLHASGLGLDRAAETLRLTGIGESSLIDVIGSDLLEAANPRMATYARPDAVDVRISATADDEHSAAEIVAAGIALLSPRIDDHVFARGQDGWPEALRDRLRSRRVAVAEIGCGGEVGHLLGAEPWLVLDRQTATHPAAHQLADVASELRRDTDVEIGLAVQALERQDDDMDVEIAIDLEGEITVAAHKAFLGGDIGRRRAANLACAELWGRLK